MVKRFCDCCGKEMGATWYEVKVHARTSDDVQGTTMEAFTENLSQVFEPVKEYCKACVDVAMLMLEKEKGIQ